MDLLESMLARSAVHVDCDVSNPRRPEPAVTVPRVLVDARSEDTWIPESVLRSLDVRPIAKKLAFQRNGETITCSYGHARLRVCEFESISRVVFGQEGDPTVLGGPALGRFGAQVLRARSALPARAAARVKLVALAGLPGTGKSTLAREVARRFDAPLLERDHVRAALFGPKEIEFSREQDDLVMDCIYRIVEFHAKREGVSAVVIDGRNYVLRSQIEELRAFATRLGTPLALIECKAAPEVVRARLERSNGLHPAATNGSFNHYPQLRAAAEPIAGPKLVLATDELSREELGDLAATYIDGL